MRRMQSHGAKARNALSPRQSIGVKGARVQLLGRAIADGLRCLIDIPTPPGVVPWWGSWAGDATMRTITDHIINPCNDKLTIIVTDEPGAGGANHRYEVHGYNAITNPGHQPAIQCDNETVILFQNGPIPENGTNGITHEVLLAIVADRLRSFQKGPYSCKANACALTHIEEAQHWLQQRTIERMRRGVEGTHTV